MTHPARLLIAACCAALIAIVGISKFRHREDSATPPVPSGGQLQPQAAAISEMAPTQKSGERAPEGDPSVEESARSSAITAFRQWAETAAASGSARVDEAKGMELAKARAVEMKTLIQQNPASALRQALSADLRALLPPQIAAAIEQPVKTTGMCSMRMICNHSSDSPHGNCESTPVLLGDVYEWNAYYGSEPWQSYVGQSVGFEGVAVDGELAVQGITPTSTKSNP